MRSVYRPNNDSNAEVDPEYLRLIGIRRSLARHGRAQSSVKPRFISRKYIPYVFTVIIALGMEFWMSLYFTSLFSGVGGISLTGWLKTFTDNFLTNWAKMFAVGLLAALPASFIVTACARLVVRKIFKLRL